MGRSPCCDENGLKKGPWTPEEDQKLVDFIQKRGHGSWRALPKLAGLNRCGKSCRLRWTNYLRPDIKRGKFSPEEEQIILNLHSILGNKWSAIATHLPGRTDNEIKNFWNTHLKKKLIQMGFDPMTHRPRTDVFAALPGLLALANLCDLVDRRPWDDHSLNLPSSESNIHQSAQLQYFQYLLQSAANNVAQNQTSLSPSNSNYMINNSTMPTSHLDLDLDLDLDLPESQFGGGDQEFEQQIVQPCYDANDQLDCSGFDDAFFGQGENGGLLGLESLPPLITDGSVGPTSSSEGSDGSGLSSFWAPELLLHDPFTTEFF